MSVASPHRLQAGFADFIVWLAWMGGVLTGLTLLGLMGPRLPYSDDWSMVPVITGAAPLSPSWLWAQHNEHRIVLPKLLFVTAARISGGDFRAATVVNIALLAAVAAALMLVVRKIRGRTSTADAFLPLLLLNPGQGGFYWGFQFQFVSSTAVACGLLALLLSQGPVLTTRAALAAAAGLLCLPLCGGNGLLYVPPLAFWLGLRGFLQWRTSMGAPTPPEGSRTFSSVWMISGAIGALALLAYSFVGYRPISHPWPAATGQETLVAALRVLASAFGNYSDRFWPFSGLATAGVLLGGLGWTTCTVVRFAKHAAWFRSADLAVFLVAAGLLALGVGYGRGGRPWDPGLSTHYSSLALPAFVAAYLAWTLSAPIWPRRLVQSGLLAALILFSAAYAKRLAGWNRSLAKELAVVEADLQTGLPAAVITDRHLAQLFYIDLPETRIMVENGIRQLRSAPFGRYGPPEPLGPIVPPPTPTSAP